MAHPASAANTLRGADQSHVPAAHARGRRFLVARGVWLLLAASVGADFVVGIPAYYAQQRTLCTTNLTQCAFNNLPTPATVQALHRLGLSLEVYAALSACLVVGGSLIFLAVGVLIFWRRSDTWLGLFTSWVLVIWGGFATNLPHVLVTAGPLYQPYEILLNLLGGIFILSVAVFLLTFPTGRFEPGWTWVVTLLFVALFISFNLPAPYNTAYWPGVLFAGALLLTYGSPLAVQIYRYRRVYTPLERQQVKWLVFGASVGIAIEALSIVIGSVVPGLNAPDSPYQLLNSVFTQLFFVSIPLAIGIAVLRYRLWDIDTIINKALVYGLLTALLAGLYVSLIIGLEHLVGLFGGMAAQNPVALVLSTLAIAALFQPLRRGIQNLIDRRFYQRKYDAEKTLAAFGAALRNEVNLEQVREQLLAAVNETMQPARGSLWLHAPARQAQPAAWRRTGAPAGTIRTGPASPTSAEDRQSSAEGDYP